MKSLGKDQAAVLESLESADAYPHETGAIERIETHISCVYLTGPFAYKVKKAVQLPYLDFSTLERRERACRDELALNRRLASSLYHEVVGIGGVPGQLRVGAVPTVEFAVKMAQFPRGATADRLIAEDALDVQELIELAEQMAEFHASLPPAAENDAADRILANLTELETELEAKGQFALAPLGEWIRSELTRCATILERRSEAGCVRECHGDLHLGNIVRWEGALVPFDCLEFSRALRTIDIADETAFLFMDLAAHARTDLAAAYLNRYLEISGDYGGLRLLRLYVAHRALVRAKVAVASTGLATPETAADRARRYLETASRQACRRRPLCAITSGLSGSGKTTIARELARKLGAVHVRSDIERKRLHGLQPSAASHSGIGEGIYDPSASDAAYRRLLEATESSLAGGVDIIADASFISRRRRERFRGLAARLDADFLILACSAPEETLRRRIVERRRAGSDASEADLAVLEHQQGRIDVIGDDERPWVLTLDTLDTIDVDRLAADIRRRFTQSSSSTSS